MLSCLSAYPCGKCISQHSAHLLNCCFCGWAFCQGVDVGETMNCAQIARADDWHAGLHQLAGVGFAFIAQDVTFGSYDQRRRKAFQVLKRSAQRTRAGFGVNRLASTVVAPEPLGGILAEEVPGRKLPARGQVWAASGCGINQDLRRDPSAAALLAHHASRRGHGASGAVTGNGNAAWISPDLCTMLCRPLRSPIGL